VSGANSYDQNSRYFAFFYKNTTIGSDTISLTSTGSLTPNATASVTVSAGSPGSAYNYQFVGRTGTLPAYTNLCQPYLVTIADSSGRTVHYGSDQNVTLTVASGGGTVGTFDDGSCNSPYSGAPTAIPTIDGFATVYLTATSTAGATNILTSTGSPLSTGTLNISTP
jgi:hypothetical protein